MVSEIPARVGFIDLETLPGDARVGMDLSRAPGWEPEPLAPIPPRPRTQPRNLRRPETIRRWQDEEAERLVRAGLEAIATAQRTEEEDRLSALDRWRGTSLDGYRARIGCIAYAFGEGVVGIIDCAEDEEGGLDELARLIVRNPASCWVAHNGHRFDFPMIQLRALHYGMAHLAARYHQGKPWDGRLVDTLEWWPSLGGWGNRYKGKQLGEVCAHLGVDHQVDNPISGGEVLDAYVEGRWDQVIDHAAADVRDLREVYRVLREVRGERGE